MNQLISLEALHKGLCPDYVSFELLDLQMLSQSVEGGVIHVNYRIYFAFPDTALDNPCTIIQAEGVCYFGADDLKYQDYQDQMEEYGIYDSALPEAVRQEWFKRYVDRIEPEDAKWMLETSDQSLCPEVQDYLKHKFSLQIH